jgi:hypothetical protein
MDARLDPSLKCHDITQEQSQELYWKEDWRSALPFHEKAVGVNPFFCGWDKFIS